MGAAKARRRAKINELRQEIISQSQETEVVQVPVQLNDGWYRGLSDNWLPLLLDEWKEHKRDRQLWVYRIDRYWVKQKWKTPSGNFADRGDLIVQVRTTEMAKELWLNTVSQVQFLDNFAPQIEAVKRGETGPVQFWWFRRFLLCRSVSEEQSMPVNYWEYYPLVEVYHPDGTREESALDMAEFLDAKKSFEQDPKAIESAAPWEKKVFADCIQCEVL